MKHLLGFACAGLTLLLVSSRASADDSEHQEIAARRVTQSASATSDAIHLRDGGLLHGRLTEIVAGDHVSLVVANGETQSIAWAEIERVVVATTSFPPRPAAPPAATIPAPMVGPRARVHIASSGKAYLYRRAAGTTEFVTACESPCDLEMPLGDTYTIGGSGFTTTKEIHLDAPEGGHVDLSVDGPNWVGIVGGGVLVVGGVVPTYIGLLLAPFASLDDGVRDLALGCLGVGGAAIGLGLVSVFVSMRTDLTQKTERTPTKEKPSLDAFVRAPQWRAASEQGGPARATFPMLFERAF